MKIHDNFRQVVIMMTSDLYGTIFDDIINYRVTEENKDKEVYYNTYSVIHDLFEYHIYVDKRSNKLIKYYYLNVTEEESNDITLNTYIEYIKTFDKENEYRVFEVTEDDGEYFGGKMTLPPQVYTGTVMFGPWDNDICTDEQCINENINDVKESNNNISKINLVLEVLILIMLTYMCLK